MKAWMVLIVAVLMVPIACLATANGSWLKKVPQADRGAHESLCRRSERGGRRQKLCSAITAPSVTAKTPKGKAKRPEPAEASASRRRPTENLRG